MSDDKARNPILHMVHELNHTQVSRVGSLASAHSSDSQIIMDLDGYEPGVQYYNLNPGVYRINIEDNDYIFDIYRTLTGDDYFQIQNVHNAYMRCGFEKLYVVLYRVLGTHTLSEAYGVNDTVNNWFDLLIVDGYSVLDSIYGNTVPSISLPMTFSSISSLTFSSKNESGNKTNELTMNLKNFIKSLPNGTKDTCIINSELEKFHIITRIGRTTFSGYESWSELEDWCDDIWCYYFCKNNNVKIENSDDNIRCTHLQCYYANNLKLIDYPAIATCADTEIGNGFIMKISANTFDYEENTPHITTFQKWLNDIFLSGHPMIVEYPLAETDYRSFLLDEYHVRTYYDKTEFSLENASDCNISYFYKAI